MEHSNKEEHNMGEMIIETRLKGRSFWEMEKTSLACWNWNHLLYLMDQIRNKCIMKVGDGRNTSIWFDNWSAVGPLCKIESNRNIHEDHIP